MHIIEIKFESIEIDCVTIRQEIEEFLASRFPEVQITDWDDLEDEDEEDE
jgi:hypothetical protein